MQSFDDDASTTDPKGFNQASATLLNLLKKELGTDYEIVDEREGTA